MPHNTLRLQGGTVVNETPVLNQTGIASCNRIRFKYDPQGLSLPEKLGGWAKFYASTITNGVVRALWGWQDTNNRQWIAFATDNTTGAELGVIQCTTSGSTGLTTATGTLENITPSILSTFSAGGVVGATAGSNIYNFLDNSTASFNFAVNTYYMYITNPIAISGVVLQGQYQIIPSISGSGNNQIAATDILGNPLNAVYNPTSSAGITSVSFAGGTPNTLTFHFTGPYTVPVYDAVNVFDSANVIDGTYQVIASTSTSFTVAITLSSYTYGGTGAWNNFGTTAQFYTTSGSTSVTYFLPNHGYSVGDTLSILNPTLVGGIEIQGQYTVVSVINPGKLTFAASSAATATSQQFQGAIPISGGTPSGANVTFTYPSLYSSWSVGVAPTSFNVWVQGVNPSAWNGHFVYVSSPTSTSVQLQGLGSHTGSYVSGGSFSAIGGVNILVYSSTLNTGSSVTNPTPGAFWSLDNWGNDLIAVPGNAPAIAYPTQPLLYQPIYFWDPNAGVTAQAIANAPVVNNGAFVAMPQRQIIAWGSSFTGIIDPLLIRWCDINDFNTWVAQTTNQAGSFRLPSGAEIVGARQNPQQGLIWTDIELWSMQYINQPYVYSFNKIGQGCGLIAKNAHGTMSGITYWMSKTQFFWLSGDGVVSIPCPVWDVIFQDLDLVNADKIMCATNSMFKEITWYYPVKGGNGENSAYIKMNVSGIVLGQPPMWDYGTLDRTAWIDVSVLQQPIGYSPANQLIYQHEISPDADGLAMGEFFTTGWFAIAEGDQMPYTDQWWPDMKWGYYGQSQNASVTMTFAGEDYPGQSTYANYGPYTITQATTYISPRIRHRLQSFTVSGTGTGTWWRLGGIRYRWQPDGRY